MFKNPKQCPYHKANAVADQVGIRALHLPINSRVHILWFFILRHVSIIFIHVYHMSTYVNIYDSIYALSHIQQSNGQGVRMTKLVGIVLKQEFVHRFYVSGWPRVYQKKKIPGHSLQKIWLINHAGSSGVSETPVVHWRPLRVDWNWLVVDLPLWKIWKSVGIIIPNIWKNKKMIQTTNQI